MKNKRFLLTCFFFSGFCGLVYEVIWLRVMSLIFGNTTYATSTVLSSFMAGLGLGALYFGRRIDKKGNPVLVYAWMEAGVGVYALLTPLLWKLMEWLSVGFYRSIEPSFLQFSLFKFLLAFVCIFPLTFLMGGTLPVISKALIKDSQESAKFVGKLYALNTFGAVCGVLVTGFYALYTFGLWQTTFFAAALNIGIFWLCRKFLKTNDYRFEPQSSQNPEEEITGKLNPPQVFLLLFLFGISGGVSMFYEVGWTRILANVLGGTVYAFCVMLATFLLGIALGSYVCGAFVNPRRLNMWAFSLMQMGVAAFVLLGLNEFNEMPFRFISLYRLAKAQALLIEAGKFLFCASVMFLPTFLLGAMFTCFVHIVRRNFPLGRQIGSSYFSNTIGTIVGSLLAGFLFIPTLGVQKTLIWGASLNVFVGIVIFFMVASYRHWAQTFISMLVVAAVIFTGVKVKPWDLTVMTRGLALQPQKVIGNSREDLNKSLREREVLFYKEALNTTVSVVRWRDNIALAVNGKVDASNHDLFTQYFLGHLPMLLHPNPQKVLVIGLGSGSTLAAVASYPVTEIDGVELEKAVVEASDFFKDLNRNVLHDPRVKMFVNDGRNVLLVRPDKYDVIISEPSNPWIAGVANLFSLEHFQLMNRRLNPGGLVCQWVHTYQMSTQDLAMIINTFSKAFGHVQLWSADQYDLMLVGSNEAFAIDWQRFSKYLKDPIIASDLSSFGTPTPESLLASFWLDDKEIRFLTKEAKVHTDNLPLLEFSAPRNLYAITVPDNYRWLNSQRTYIYPLVNTGSDLNKKADFYFGVARGFLGRKFYIDAKLTSEMAQLLDPQNPLFLEMSGIIDYSIDALDRAEEHLTEALRLDPQLSESQHYLGLVYLKEGKVKEALGYLQKAVSLQPDNSLCLEHYGDALVKDGQFVQALTVYEKLLQERKEDFATLRKIKNIHLRLSPVPVKIEALKRFIKEYPLFDETYLELAQVLQQLQLYPQALAALKKYERLNPNDEKMYIFTAMIFEKLGDKIQMAEALRKAVKIDPALGRQPEIKKVLERR